MQKQIDALKKQLDDLQKKFDSKNSSSNMFGRSYSEVGSSDSDFVIKTRGQVKIKWGNKFIDILKGDKLNVDTKFIYAVDNINSKSKDGLYVDSENTVYLKYAGKDYKLSAEVLEDTETTVETEQSSEIPSGTILMFHGKEIPTGWVICDGTNNTPDLTGKFLKGAKTSQLTTEVIETSMTESPNIYEIIFIMKI